MEGHKGWVMYVAFSPCCSILASAGMDNNILLWDAKTGEQHGKTVTGHKKCITSLTWEPLMHMKMEKRFASSSKDGTVRIWSAYDNTCIMTLGGHTASVQKVLWGGEGMLYSAS